MLQYIFCIFSSLKNHSFSKQSHMLWHLDLFSSLISILEVAFSGLFWLLPCMSPSDNQYWSFLCLKGISYMLSTRKHSMDPKIPYALCYSPPQHYISPNQEIFHHFASEKSWDFPGEFSISLICEVKAGGLPHFHQIVYWCAIKGKRTVGRIWNREVSQKSIKGKAVCSSWTHP